MEIEGEVKYARSTKVYYNVTHEMYVKDTIGNENMGSLKYMNLQQFFNKMAEKYNPPTLKNIKKLFAVTFKYALRVGYIRENPIPYISPKYLHLGLLGWAFSSSIEAIANFNSF